MFTRFTAFLKPTIGKAVLAIGMLAAATAFAMPQPALADTRSTAEIVAAAALIVGAVVFLLVGQSRSTEPAVTLEMPVRDVA